MNGIKPDPDIKMDPDAITPSGSGYMDDEFYEDTGEMQLPPKGSDKDIWLTRIPKWLYDAVAKWDGLLEDGQDTDTIQLGEVLALRDPDRPNQLSRKDAIRVILNHKAISGPELPQAYDLVVPPQPKDKDDKSAEVGEVTLANTYIFTEKDLPGYKPNGFGYGKTGGSGGFGIQDPKARVQKRSKYKKAIPKQTTLLGCATREYTANPLPTKEFIEFTKRRNRHATQGNSERTNIVENFNEHQQNINLTKQFKSFVRPAAPARSQINKAARIPKNDLIDLLHTCFDEYTYWPMKALKVRTKQPEAYLKEVLGDIAVLVKTGPFSSNWMRQGMYGRDISNRVDGLAPEVNLDDDDEEPMEDVV